MTIDAALRGRRITRGIHLEYLTIGWEYFGRSGCHLSAGLMAGSVALLWLRGGTLPSKSCSGAVLLLALASGISRQKISTKAEQTALKLVGISLLLLAAYVSIGRD